MTYQRITYRPEGAKRARSVILRDATTTRLFTTGIEVNREGDEIASAGHDERRHMIDNALIEGRQELTMNLHYGTLEEAP